MENEDQTNILLVDDNANNLIALEAMLADLGQNIVTARSGMEALKSLLAQEFAVILLDVQMPVINGFEAAELIRKRPQSQWTPIIFLTAIEKTDDQMLRGYSHGAVDYVFKPIVPAILKAKVTAFVDLFKARAEIQRRRARELTALDRLKHVNATLASREALLAGILDSSSDAIITVTTDGVIRSTNKGAHELVHYDEHELLGKNIDQVLCAGEVGTLLAAAGGGGADHKGATEVKVRTKTGSVLDCEIAVREISPDPDDAGLFTAILHDVTERRQAEDALKRFSAELESRVKERTEELERSNAELRQFAYVASHDLQEPLRMVASYLGLLERRYKGQLDKDADEFIAFAVDGARRMKGLIDDLLSYSRVGTRGQRLRPVEADGPLEHALANLGAAIADSAAVITHDPLPCVTADASQLAQLFENLLGNAIKFHGARPPRVHVSAERAGEQWVFAVADNGIGVEPQYTERIFQVFQHLHARDEFPGSGIGLAVCKKIVQRHGGRIWLDSQPGEGAIFRFTMPASQPAAIEKEVMRI